MSYRCLYQHIATRQPVARRQWCIPCQTASCRTFVVPVVPVDRWVLLPRPSAVAWARRCRTVPATERELRPTVAERASSTLVSLVAFGYCMGPSNGQV